jgi:hypothetical protein
MTHTDIVGVYDDHPVIRPVSQVSEEGIDRGHTHSVTSG